MNTKNVDFSPGKLKNGYLYILSVSFAAVFNMVASFIEQWIMRGYNTLAADGQLMARVDWFFISNVMASIILFGTSYLSEYYAKKDLKKFRDVVYHVVPTTLLTGLSGFLFLCYFIYSVPNNQMDLVLVAKKYYLIVCLFHIMPYALNLMMKTIFLSTGRTKIILYTEVCTRALQILYLRQLSRLYWPIESATTYLIFISAGHVIAEVLMLVVYGLYIYVKMRDIIPKKRRFNKKFIYDWFYRAMPQVLLMMNMGWVNIQCTLIAKASKYWLYYAICMEILLISSPIFLRVKDYICVTTSYYAALNNPKRIYTSVGVALLFISSYVCAYTVALYLYSDEIIKHYSTYPDGNPKAVLVFLPLITFFVFVHML